MRCGGKVSAAEGGGAFQSWLGAWERTRVSRLVTEGSFTERASRVGEIFCLLFFVAMRRYIL